MICLFLVLVTLAVYWPVRGYDFVGYDDPDYIINNSQVQAGLTWPGVVWAFTADWSGNWHPVTWLSHMLDVTLFGPGPGGPHLMNLLLHEANSCLVFLVLRRLTAATWRSAIVAALFALHPLHVESVAWIAERKDVLSAFFGLLTLWAYSHYAAARLRAKKWYGLALLFFALGLMSKPMLVTLPAVLLLLDYWPLRRWGPEARTPVVKVQWLVVEKIPFLLLSAGSSLATMVAQKSFGAVVVLAHLPLAARLENAFVAYARYLGKILWPVNLAVLYPHPGYWPGAVVGFSAVLLAGLTAVVLWQWRRLPYLVTGWLWFLGMLVPVIGLVQVGNQSMADRYAYVPVIGIFLALVWGAGAILVRVRVPKAVLIVMVTVILLACAFRTRDQLGGWQNTGTLFRHALAVTQNNAIAYENLANYLADQGRNEEAITNFLEAARIDPESNGVHNDLGVSLVKVGRLDAAVVQFQEAIRCEPGDTNAYLNLGVTLTAENKFTEAEAQLNQALRLNPNFAEVHNDLGYTLMKLNRFDEAAAQLAEALRIKPEYPQAHYNLGCALAQLGRRTEAAAQLTEALRLKPDYEAARQSLTALGVVSP